VNEDYTMFLPHTPKALTARPFTRRERHICSSLKSAIRRGFFGLILTGLLAGQTGRATKIPRQTMDGFTVPQPQPVFRFPRDHGSHPDYKIEWWYITGHLVTEAGKRFGFQATFFRSAAPKTVAAQTAPVAFGHDQLYLAHMALLEVETGRFLHQERLLRAGWDAYASTETLDLRNGDWTLVLEETKVGPETLRLDGGIRGEARFEFTFTAQKPLVKFGADGYSRKGAAPTAASYYLTFSRLAVSGTLRLGAQAQTVTGQAWMDHEYSSSQLDTNQVGWDWLSVQLHDGRELMFYRLRTSTGEADAVSSLTWIDRAGALQRAEYRWEPLSTWTSPRTGAIYPQKVRLHTTDPATGEPLTLVIEPLAADQELEGKLGGVAYWEGACRIMAADGRELGRAYMELTGYDQALKQLR
jgi:predicted secreted hydrolase